MTEYRDEPSLLLLADSEEGLERGRRSAGSAGRRIADTAPIAGAVERLQRQVKIDGVLIDIRKNHGTLLDQLLEEINAAAWEGRYFAVISTPPSLMERVAARTMHPKIQHLCDACEEELAAAIGVVSAHSPQWLHDIGREDRKPGLKELSDDLSRLAKLIVAFSDEQEKADVPAKEGRRKGDRPRLDAATVRSIIRARRLRDQYFPADLFADPAWDMLLDLMAARLEKQRVAVSSLCIAAAVPPTTALRWIKTLTDMGLLVRTADPQDGRRVYIELSDKAAAGVETYLGVAHRVTSLIV